MRRKSYEQSFQELAEAVALVGDPKPGVERPPRADDAEPGPGLVGIAVEAMDFFDLTLPGLYLERCDLRRVALTGSDLRLSTARWSDFSRCDFTDCDLSGADLRGCTFEDCSFRGARLARADLRSCSFARCGFEGADFGGATLSASVLDTLPLSPEQRGALHASDGPDTPEA